MQTRFATIQQLAQQGMCISATARALKLHRHTVQKYRACTTAPQRRYTTRRTSTLTPYQGYLVERWTSGCRNARQLWREVVAQGYPGTYRTVARLPSLASPAICAGRSRRVNGYQQPPPA